MRFRLGRGAKLGLAVAAMLLASPARPGAQVVGPPPLPTGGWAQVITVTPKWLVLQNEAGQQFPVSLSKDSVNLFVVRWPITADQISASAVIEVIGYQDASNQLRADHLDVFENDAKGLLHGFWPSVVKISPTGVPLTPYYVDQNNAYLGFDYVNAYLNNNGAPDRLHVVAPVFGINPVRLAVGNNNAETILPGANGLFMTQVTAGSASFCRPGDLVFFIPVQTTPKSLVLAQLVVYKSMPLSQFGN